MQNPNGFFYWYLYPIISSIFAGFVFWIIFSFLPDRRRRKSFGIGVMDDLIKLNYSLFNYFDVFLKHQKHSTSFFQNKIHACSLKEEELNIILQNKILNEKYNYYNELNGRLICIDDEIRTCQFEIKNIINRLYSFNFYLSSFQIDLLRSIQEKVFRYSLEIEPSSQIGGIVFRVADPSLSYMTKVLLELQDAYKELRTIIFKSKLTERNYIITKIQRLFFLERYKECVSECNRWNKKYPFDSDLQLAYKTHSLNNLGLKNLAYESLQLFLNKNDDVISYREFIYPMLNDPTSARIIYSKIGKEKINEMKKIVEGEKLMETAFMASNAELKQFYSSKK